MWRKFKDYRICSLFFKGFTGIYNPQNDGVWFFKTMGFISQNDAYIFWGVFTPLFFCSEQYFLSALSFVSCFRFGCSDSFSDSFFVRFLLGFVWWLLFCVYFCSEDSVANDYRFLARRRADANQSSDFLYSSVVSLPSKIQISLMSCPSFILLRITRFM